MKNNPTAITTLNKDDLIVAPYLLIAQTDSRHFIPLSEATYRFLSLKVDADQISGFHGTNERVSVEEYGRAVEVFYQLIRNTNEL